MTATTYAQALTAATAPAIAAQILATMAAATPPVLQSGWDATQIAAALVPIDAAALAYEQALRVQVLQAADPLTVASLGQSWAAAFARIFGETPIPALPAAWSLSVVASANVGPYDVAPGGLVAQDINGALYALTGASAQGGVLGIAAGPSSTLAYFTAQAAGLGGNVAPGAITSLMVGLSGLSISLSGQTLVSAGRNIETPAALVSRCLAKWGALGAGGNLAAYNYRIPTGTPAITRWYIRRDNPNGPGSVWVFLADGAGPASSPEVASVEAYLQSLQALGTGLITCFPCPQQTIAIACQLITDGSNPNAATQAAAALVAFGAAFGLEPGGTGINGGTLYADAVIEILEGIDGVVNLSPEAPIADTTIASGTLLTITPTITQV